MTQPRLRTYLARIAVSLCALTSACATPAVFGPHRRGGGPGLAQIARGDVSLVSWQDLPAQDPRSRELSAAAWNDATRTLYVISSQTRGILSLQPDAQLRRWTFGPTIPVNVQGRWDGEEVALDGPDFLVANEAGPHVYRFDAQGNLRGEVPLPERYLRARHNRSLESLTLSPDRRYLFVANESALRGDGTTGSDDDGTVVRIYRLDLRTGVGAEFAYRTDPIFAGGHRGDIGVSAMAALSGETVLVLERAYAPSAGNSVRIYAARLSPRADVTTQRRLGKHTTVVPKTLLVDLATIHAPGLPQPREPQRSALLENFEGLALGPALPDGRRLLFLVSDDNLNPRQFARIVVLAARLPE